MKKTPLIAAILLVVGILSVGIVDNLSTLTEDIDNHTWLNLVGRWQSCEKGYYEIAFGADRTFVEYFHGIGKGSGEYQVSGNRLTLKYGEPDCANSGAKDCRTILEFGFDGKTLVLTAGESRMLYKKVENP
ncbi:MAG: hypothetical protein JW748_07800 [Anaerolineales bacterium]|nr:hypothetical protein [Anaerolineales bacterium]